MVSGTSDLFVRYLLGSEKNIALLVDFINAVLVDCGFETIRKAEITNPFNLKEYSIDKETILDIKAVSETNKTFNVEIQNHPENSYVKRSLYYWARLYGNQLDEGSEYDELKPVICINLLSCTLFNNSRKAHTCFLVTEKDNKNSILTDDLQINYLELPKFESKYNLKDRLSIWAWFFRFVGVSEKEDEMEFLLKQDPVIQEAHHIYKTFNEDRKLKELSEAREKRLKDEATRLGSALRKGREEGRWESAVNLKKLGVASDIISKATGLPVEDIEKL